MNFTYFFGRTTPGLSVKELQAAVTKISATAKKRLRYLPTAHCLVEEKRWWPPQAMTYKSFDARTFQRTLPAYRLPDGRCPFILNTHQSGAHFVGKKYFSGSTDPLIDQFLDLLKAQRGVRELTFRTRNLGIWCEFVIASARENCNLRVDWSSNEETVFPVQDTIAQLGLSEHHPCQIRAQSNRNDDRIFENVDLYTTFPNLMHYIDTTQHLWEVFATVKASVKEVDEETQQTKYDLYRQVLNQLATDWNSSAIVFYSKGFDPFQHPGEVYPDMLDHRFPVIQYFKMFPDEPQIQIEVVHSRDETYLEFVSVEGPETLQKYAKRGGLKLEIWNGIAHERWT